MEACAYGTRPPAAASALFGFSAERVKELCSCAASAVIRNVFYAILAFFFGVAGSTLGAIAGALFTLKIKSGFFQGASAAAIGAVSGAVIFNEVIKASIAFWNSDDDRLGCLLHFIQIFARILEGRLRQEQFGPTAARPGSVLNQETTVETNLQMQRFFNTRDANLLSRGSIGKIPKIRITTRNIHDSSGNRMSCSVCLQDFHVEDVAGSLPHCRHMFHPPCIAEWLIRQSSCPLCRRSL